jgi:hypothetical protein
MMLWLEIAYAEYLIGVEKYVYLVKLIYFFTLYHIYLLLDEKL